jgi:hypothetical protein
VNIEQHRVLATTEAVLDPPEWVGPRVRTMSGSLRESEDSHDQIERASIIEVVWNPLFALPVVMPSKK